MLKITTSLFIILMSFSLFAKSDPSTENFQEKKTKVLENIGKRINSLTQLKTCVTGANSKEEMATCRQANHERMKELKPRGRRRGQGKGQQQND